MDALRQRLTFGDLELRLAAVLAAALSAAVYTFSAYLVDPLVLPLALIGAAFVVVALARPAWGVAGALLATPLEIFGLPLPSGGISPTEGAMALVGIAWAVRALVRPESVVFPGARDLAPLALLGVIAVGLVTAFDPAPVVRVLTLWTLFYFVYLQAQSFSPREMRLVVAALVTGAGILGAVGAVGYLQSGSTGLLGGGTITTARAVGTFADPNYYAALLVLALLPALALAIGNVRRNGWLLLPIAGAFLGLLFSLSRGGILGFALGLLLLLVWGRARGIALAAIALTAALTLAGANPIVESDQFGVVQQRLATIEQVNSVTGKRQEIWGTALEVAQDKPFFGAGMNQFRSEAARRGLYEDGDPLENAHSIPLSLAAETGFLGLAAFLAFVVQLALRAGRAMATTDRFRYALAVGISAALLGFLIQGLTVAQIRMQVVTATFFVLAGMLTRLADLAREADGGLPAPGA